MTEAECRLKETLKTLCCLDGVSGDEGAVRDYIRTRLAAVAQSITTDSMGNLYVEIKGEKRPERKLMVAAHMDEVGFMVKSAGDDGSVKLVPAGGFDDKVLPSRRVRFANGTRGIIGMKAIHLTTQEERKKVIPLRDLYLDVGTRSENEAYKLVSPGDTAAFDSEFEEFGDGFIKAKAIDDRAGCAVMILLAEDGIPYDATFVFTVQEEVGCRGASVAANRVKPGRALILEGTTAADVANVPDARRVCRLGGGAVSPFMDGGAIYDERGFNMIFDTAAKLGIKAQAKEMVAGGTDASVITRANTGAPVNALAVPVRYLHAAATVAKLDDIAAVYRLAAEFIARADM